MLPQLTCLSKTNKETKETGYRFSKVSLDYVRSFLSQGKPRGCHLFQCPSTSAD